MVSIAKYTIDCSYRFDRSSIRQVDRAMKELEKKLKAFSTKKLKSIFAIKKFDVNQKKLNTSLGNALDKASTSLVFEISRFSVNDRNLRATMLRAQGRVGVGFGLNVNGMRGVANRQSEAPLQVRRGRRGTGGRDLLFAGGAAGAVARVGFAGLPVIGGALGLGAFNRKNQEVVAAQLQTQAVVQQAGGTAEQGQQSFQFLRGEANRIGFNYLDAAGDYNKLIAGLTGSGVGLQESQQVFSGFAELARVNKLDKTTQNRLFRALSQVAGKGKLMAEELTGQIAEALPGGTALFAQAYQQKTGGKLTGQAAIKQLLDDMKKGKVTSDILTFAGAQASIQANKGGALVLASKASQAEQGRFQSALADMSIVASGAGLESGFARVWKSLTNSMNESKPIVEGLAKAFDTISKYFEFVILIPQSIQRAFEGRDSWFADIIGPEGMKFATELKDTMLGLAVELKKTFGIVIEGWNQIFKEFGPGFLAAIRNFGEILRLSLKMLNSYVTGDTDSATNAAAAIRGVLSGESPENIKKLEMGQPLTAPIPKTVDELVSGGVSLQNQINTLPQGEGFWQGTAEFTARTKLNANKARVLGQLATNYSNDPSSPMYGDIGGARDFAKQQIEAAMQQSSAATNNVSIGKIEIVTQATDAQGIARDIEPHIFKMIHESRASEYNNALMNMPQTE